MKVLKKKRGGRNFVSGLNRPYGEKLFHSYLVQSLWFQTLDPDKKINGIVTVTFEIEKLCLEPFILFVNEEKIKKMMDTKIKKDFWNEFYLIYGNRFQNFMQNSDNLKQVLHIFDRLQFQK